MVRPEQHGPTMQTRCDRSGALLAARMWILRLMTSKFFIDSTVRNDSDDGTDDGADDGKRRRRRRTTMDTRTVYELFYIPL